MLLSVLHISVHDFNSIAFTFKLLCNLVNAIQKRKNDKTVFTRDKNTQHSATLRSRVVPDSSDDISEATLNMEVSLHEVITDLWCQMPVHAPESSVISTEIWLMTRTGIEPMIPP